MIRAFGRRSAGRRDWRCPRHGKIAPQAGEPLQIGRWRGNWPIAPRASAIDTRCRRGARRARAQSPRPPRSRPPDPAYTAATSRPPHAAASGGEGRAGNQTRAWRARVRRAHEARRARTTTPTVAPRPSRAPPRRWHRHRTKRPSRGRREGWRSGGRMPSAIRRWVASATRLRRVRTTPDDTRRDVAHTVPARGSHRVCRARRRASSRAAGSAPWPRRHPPTTVTCRPGWPHNRRPPQQRCRRSPRPHSPPPA